MATKPTHEQAQLHLQVYEQRREARLRQARDWFFKNYFVENFDDSMRIAAPGTENGTHAMMVLSYWEQACALLDYGLLHEDLFFETSGEFFGVWELAKAAVPQADFENVNRMSSSGRPEHRGKKQYAKNHAILVVRWQSRRSNEFLYLHFQYFKDRTNYSLWRRRAWTEGSGHVCHIPARWTR